MPVVNTLYKIISKFVKIYAIRHLSQETGLTSSMRRERVKDEVAGQFRALPPVTKTFPSYPIDFCHLANYNMIMENREIGLGEIIRQQRVTIPLTLQELASQAAVSPSHLGRIERGERFPSARILRKIAKPLGFEEDELFTLAGYLSPQPAALSEARQSYSGGRLDPYVSKVLAQEPIEVQHAVIGILSILKSIAKGIVKESSQA
jgi:transcriptional regulator with XRE-family HTH domain